MRHIFFRLWALLLVEGVSGDEKVTVMEGDSVTLKHGGSEVQTGDLIVWKFNDFIIMKIEKTAEVFTSNDVRDERFRDRLKLDQTGSLTITNIRTTDSGLYQLNIKSIEEVSKEYSVTVSGASGVDKLGFKSVSVMKGDTVLLFAGVTEIQKNDQIQFWKLGNPDILIANLGSESWSNIRKDNKTGKLNIINIQSNQSGYYRVEINTSSMNLHRKFHINVNDVVESVSVMEGDSVTLHTGVTQKQRDDVIVWKFKDKVLRTDGLNGPDKSWKNIYLDHQTGKLTISNIQRDQSGVYEVNISSLILHRKFNITVDKMKTESVMEGDSVTLNPDLTQIQGIILILWRFGASGSVIAETVGNEISYPPFTEIFIGRLQLDHQTGSLTINNMRTKHSGLYQLEINHNTGSSRLPFIVTVSESKDAFIDVGEAEMKSVPVKEGDPVILQTDVTETHGDELIVWRFGDEGKLIAKHDIEAKSSPLYKTDGRFRDRLKLSDQPGSLTITNSRTTDSGLYRVKISSNKQTIYKRFNVTVSDPGLSSAVPDPGLSAGAVAGIVVAVVLLVFAAVAGVIYHRRKIS